MNDWFLSSNLATIPELLFFDIYQWLRFFACLLISFLAKLMAYFALLGLWFYKVSIAIIIDPDKVFNSSKPSRRRFNRYQNRGYTPLQAYSRKYIILSCYQLHEYIDNGFCRFFFWLRTFLIQKEHLVIGLLFRTQNYFYPTLPEKGPIMDILCFSVWIFPFLTLTFLDFLERLFVATYHFLFQLVWTLPKKISTKIKQMILFSLLFISPFSKVIPRMSDPLGSNVFLTDAKCMKRCYESEIPNSSPFVNL